GLRDPMTGRIILRFGSWHGTGCVDFSPHTGLLASGGGDKIIHLWATSTGRALRELVGHERSVLAVRFSPNGELLASASWDRTVRLWDVATGKQLRCCPGHPGEIRSLVFSPDGKTLASVEVSPFAIAGTHFWDVATGKELRQLAPGFVAVSFSP